MESESVGLQVIEVIVDILFGFDIVVNFMSAIEDKSGKLITEPKQIAI